MSRTGVDYVLKQLAYRQSALNTFVIDLLLHEGRQFRYNGNITAVYNGSSICCKPARLRTLGANFEAELVSDCREGGFRVARML